MTMTASSVDVSSVGSASIVHQRTQAATNPPGHWLSWFEFNLGLFALAIPAGLLIVWMAPVDFVRFMGVAIVGTGLMGMWVSAAGLKLEHPARWRSLVASFRQHRSSSAARLRRDQRYSG